MKEKINRTFVREEAYLKLRKWIVEGDFRPGLQLKDKDLAEKMGVSRTPVREALLRLEDEGLVKTKPNCSTLVSPIDFHSAQNLYAIVCSLEQLALRESFPSFTDDHLEMMIAANQRFLKALKKRNCLSALDADYDFHSVFIQLSQNSDLERILLGLKYKLKRLDIYYFETMKEAHLSHKEHEEIIEALKKRDLPSALRALESNWKESLSRIINSSNLRGETCSKIN